MNQPFLDLCEAILSHWTGQDRLDVAEYLHAAAGVSFDAKGLDWKVDWTATRARIRRGKRLVEQAIESGELKQALVLRETGLDL